VKRNLPRADRALRIGFVPLVDAAPIALAEETGLFAKRGLRVELTREPGWATIRDKVAYGELEAVHAPVGLAFALNWGLGVLRQPCLTGWLLNSNGDAITVSRALHEEGATDAPSLAATVKAMRRTRPFTFGVPHRFSTHHFLLLHWFRPVGIVPGRDIHIVVLPPPLMAACLAAGDIDGYCVGEPYNTLAVREGAGRIVAESADILPLHPEKALVVSQHFHDRDPEAHLELIRALAEAAAQCETRAGRELAAEILAQPRYLGMDAALIRSSLLAGGNGEGGGIASASFHVFSHPEVNRPDREKANWLVAQMRLAGLLGQADLRSGPLPHHIFREDLHKAALAPLKKRPARRTKDALNPKIP
ncbi:MAG TPA: CmpA/NrtA family ABC transporter substrate-binding protein, partial [Bacteroidia bacterium]|nr:CmpA/NrtA family ABC transporter substrate-binding protein [Bacteroidia bacterium]